MKLIKGDKVRVLIGKDKGREGEIIRVIPKKNQIVVKGLNLFKKHIKASQQSKGGIVEKERALLASKVIFICPECKKAARIGYQIDKQGNKYRICKKCQALVTNKTLKK